jgi:hypothetical protein
MGRTFFKKSAADSVDNSFKARGKSFEEAKIKKDFKKLEYDLGFDPELLTEKIIEFGKVLTGIPIYNYQYEFIYRVIYSVLTKEGETLTALWARQCFGKGTKVLLSDYSTKNVEDITTDDVLMGINGEPRKVLSTTKGVDNLYEVKPRTKYGKSYVVNESHIMAYKKRKRRKPGVFTDELHTVSQYLALSKTKRENRNVGYRSITTFNKAEVELDPYFLGLWLGDGNSRNQSIYSADFEIVEYLQHLADTIEGHSLSNYGNYQYAIVSDSKHSNKIIKGLNYYNLIVNKHIPKEYLINDEATRLSVLAGIVDSDGHVSKCKGKNNVLEVTFKSESLADDLIMLAKSLGYRATKYAKIATIKSIGFSGPVFRVTIFGDLTKIPTKIARKQVKTCVLRENPLHYSFDIEPIGRGEFYGFETDGNKLFLLDDFTVVHNSGKSESLAFIIDTLCVILPILANIFPSLQEFKGGFHVGIFAPQSDQVTTTYSRALVRLNSANAQLVMSDKEIDVSNKYDAQLHLTNGSFLKGQTAAKTSKIESKTYHLIIIEEAQDCDDLVVSKSIEPMGAATMATTLKVGTTGTRKCDFYDEIQFNRKRSTGQYSTKLRYHFQYDYKEIIRQKRTQYEIDKNPFHLNYERFISKQIAKRGVESASFKLGFALLWDLETGMFITDLEWAGILDKRMNWTYDIPDGFDVRAGLDLAKENAESVLTIVKNAYDKETGKRKMQILRILTFKGDYDKQHNDFLNAIVEFNISAIYVDNTGVGKPVVDRLVASVGSYCYIHPYDFSSQSKSDMWLALRLAIETKLLIIPASNAARGTSEYEKLESQMKGMIKYYDRNYLCAHKAKKTDYDDFCDSLALANLCCLTDIEEMAEIEISDNPFFQNTLTAANLIKQLEYKNY